VYLISWLKVHLSLGFGCYSACLSLVLKDSGGLRFLFYDGLTACVLLRYYNILLGILKINTSLFRESISIWWLCQFYPIVVLQGV